MKVAIIFDCEFLCVRGSQSRFWCAAHDPDPIGAQIGAVKLGLEGDFPLLESVRAYVQPIDRFGNPYAIDRYFTELTGITEERMQVALDTRVKPEHNDSGARTAGAGPSRYAAASNGVCGPGGTSDGLVTPRSS